MIFKNAGIYENYRYWLIREWDIDKNKILWIMLNPSIADAKKDDPTIRKIINYSRDWGYGGFYVCNLYSWIETDSNKLLKEKDTDYVGPNTDKLIKHLNALLGMTILACGNKAEPARLKEVYKMIKPCYCLKVNKDGTPAHPLYLKRDLKPILYKLKNEED
jgi:hypothetical protein